MTAEEKPKARIEDPLAEIEHQLISAYVAGAGHDLQTLLARDDPEARQVLAEASRYASTRLCEIESRWQYLRKMHGES